MCGDCGHEYDDSGYYGHGDEAHLCDVRARKRLRVLADAFPLAIESMLREVVAAKEQEARDAEAKRDAADRVRLEARITEARAELARLEEHRAALEATGRSKATALRDGDHQ